ncbi:WYL domain-containing protein [Paraflavisolibacter sp. H34]|uniref:helix-turn-helix transcriptional regulator n=1 Tax=Huijunlia imazamoxiresistens TaxID=3127457 RepID=UPI003018097B
MSAHLERLIRIYNRLRRGPVTIEIISKWARGAGIEVSDRQLYRDLNQLKSLQIAEGENVVEFNDEKNRKTWKLEYEEAEEVISQFDITSFYLLKCFAPPGLIKNRKSSIEKFEKIFYKELSKSKYQQYIDTYELYLHRTNYFQHIYDEAEHRQVEEYIWALHNKRTIVIEALAINPANIHLPPDPFPLPIHPMELVFHLGRAFISGLDEQGRLMLFAVDRGTKFLLTNKTFNRKNLLPDYEKQKQVVFGISDPKDGTMHRIQIEFTANYAQSWMRYYWHASQKWEPLPNGNYMLHLHCTIGRELVGFLAYGLDRIRVHEPELLREMLVEKYRRCLAVHHGELELNEEEADKMY